MRNLVLFFVLLFVNVSGFSQITINLPLSRSVFQRDNNNTSAIHVSGVYQDTLEKIEARLVPIKEGQGTATDWVVLVDKPQFGSFVGSIKGTGGWYQLQVRGWKNGAVVTQPTIDKVGIGEVFLIAGQSNAEGKRGFGEKASIDDRVNCFNYEKIDFLDEIPPYNSFSHLDATSSIAPRGQGTWCWGELGDLLAKRLNVPIMFFNAAYQGTSIENWYSSSVGIPTKHPFYKYTFPNNTPYSYLRITLQYYISQLGLRSVLWCQGEAELEQNTTEEYYVSALKKIIEKSRVESGKKINWMISRTSLLLYDQVYPTVIKAQNSVINPADYIFEGPYTDSIQVPRTEGVHFTDAGISDLAKAWNAKLNDTFFSQSLPSQPSPIVNLKIACQEYDKVTVSLPTSYQSYKWSNNTADASITATSGSFDALVRDQTGNYFFTSSIDVKKVFPTIIPVAYTNKSAFFCEGSSTDILTDSPDYASFLWSSGEKQRQITVKNSGSFSVRGITNLGCISPESNKVFTQALTPPGKPVIYQSETVVCEGNTVTLASTGLKENIWSTNEIGQFITIAKVGTYSVTVKEKDGNGCISVSSEPATFSIIPRPETPEITQIGAFTLQAIQKTVIPDVTYEWKQDGIVLSNKTAFLKANKASFLTVASIKNYTINNKALACRSNLSGAYSFIPDVSIKDIIIYPNPTPDGFVTLEAKDNVANFTFTVYSLDGKLIYSSPIPNLSERRLVDLSFLGGGKYIVKLSNDSILETKYIWIDKK
jgi:hypothetical protein